MVLHPVAEGFATAEPQSASTGVVSAWSAVENAQKKTARQWLLITQPDHAQLAGDLAARLQSPFLPYLSPDVVRAIAVHDAGWTGFDRGVQSPDTHAGATAVPRLNDRGRPVSFIEASPAEFVVAWTASIDAAEESSLTGGMIVSRHFSRLAEDRLDARIDDEEDTSRLRHFLHHETERRERLGTASSCSSVELDALTTVLQFCDLLSLYLCCGATESVEFPQQFPVRVKVQRDADLFRFEPPLFGPGASLGISAMLYPSVGTALTRSLPFLLR